MDSETLYRTLENMRPVPSTVMAMDSILEEIEKGNQ
jgi:hypothetical protein